MTGLFDPLQSAQHWLTQGFSSTHLANDIACVNGSILRASESGVVFAASWNADGWGIGGGYCLIIDHSPRLRTLYAHNMKLIVAKGQVVVRGQVVGYTDTTGNSTGPHVHHAVRVDGTWLDPRDYYARGGSYPDANGSQSGRHLLRTSIRTRGSAESPIVIRSRPYLGNNKVGQVHDRLFWSVVTVNGGDPHNDGNNQWFKVRYKGAWAYIWNGLRVERV